MKKLLLLLALACCTGMGYAQKLVSGSLAALSHETRLNVEIDYSEAVLNNLTLDDFVATNDKWELAQTELWTKFVEKLNEGMSSRQPRLLAGHNESGYTLVLHVLDIDKKGNQRSVVKIKDAAGNTIAEINANGDGGHFGSFYNLAGDGMKDIGERVGKFIVKKIK
jgi:hypothetical protein